MAKISQKMLLYKSVSNINVNDICSECKWEIFKSYTKLLKLDKDSEGPRI